MNDTITAPVSAICDVLALRSDDGCLTPTLVPIVAAPAPAIGRARTVTITHDSTGNGMAPIFDVLSDDLTGCVLVVSGAVAVPGAVWGEILTRAAQQQGATAVLIDGWVRDRPAMATIGLPIYACGDRVAGPNGLAHVIAVGKPVLIGAVTVEPDDLIVVDGTGCVRVRAADAEAVLPAADRYAAAEDLVVKALIEGETLATAYRHKKAITDELGR